MKKVTYEKGVTIRLRCGINEYCINQITNTNGVNQRIDNHITVGHDEKLRDNIVELLNRRDMLSRINELEKQLIIEMSQFEGIRGYTQDGDLAAICMEHETTIKELLSKEIDIK